jgi:hypothetical protein
MGRCPEALIRLCNVVVRTRVTKAYQIRGGPMLAWKRAIILGILMWLIPFVIGFAAYPLHEPARPLFESIMAVAVTGTAVGLGLLYLRGVPSMGARQGLAVGVLWMALSILIDAPMFLFGGPMYMPLASYLADIGLTYVCIPVVTWGLGAARVA